MAGARSKEQLPPRIAAARLRHAVGFAIANVPVAASCIYAVEMLRAQLSAEALTWDYVASLFGVLAATSAVVARRIRRTAHNAVPRLTDDLELGTLLLACAFAPVQVFGEAFFPVVYLVMAFLVAFFPRRTGLCLVASAVAFDAILATTTGEFAGTSFLVHGGFLVLFAGLYHGVLAAQMAVSQASENAAVARRIREIEERARAYRLASSGSADRPDPNQDREKWVFAAVKEIEGAVGAALEIASLALKTHTCAVYLLRSDDNDLQLHDCRSASEKIQREPISAGEGIVGAVLKRKAPVRMCGAVKGVTWYEARQPVKSVLAVPISEGGANGLLRGVIVADRLVTAAFDDADERLLSTVAAEVVRAIEVERVLGYIKKARDEKDRFYRAIEELNRTSKLNDVYGAAIELARGIGDLDFTAITVVDSSHPKVRHRVVRVAGVASGRALEGLDFADNNGLVANVVRYGTPLPGRDVKQMDRPVVFDNKTAMKGLSALKILPLKVGDRVLGTLVAGSRRRHTLGEDAVRMLEVLGLQVAQSILRAQLFDQMERMATTDGLTGLYNHRYFQERLEALLAQARRYGRKLSLVVVDVDHFKQVNDKHGHPAGDQVLRSVAQMISKQARDTDMVARYGGEEFAVILPETDTRGAKVIAERIRVAVQGNTFEFEGGTLKATVSLGIATCPDHAKDKPGLVERADQCLYFAKRNGRNRSVTVAESLAKGAAKDAVRESA